MANYVNVTASILSICDSCRLSVSAVSWQVQVDFELRWNEILKLQVGISAVWSVISIRFVVYDWDLGAYV